MSNDLIMGAARGDFQGSMNTMEFGLDLDKIIHSQNVAEMLDKNQRDAIGQWCVQNYEDDRMSRAQWEEKNEKALQICLQVVEEKSFPWPKAANVKFPLITIAALQYHSRAYPALVPSPNIVHCSPVKIGAQANQILQEKLDSAKRISEHMNWQLTEEMREWEEGMDKALLAQPIMGTVLKKTYFDPTLQRNVSEVVFPQDFIISYYTKDLFTSQRYTHLYPWDANKIHEYEKRGFICESSTDVPGVEPMPFGRLEEVRDQSQGLSRTMNSSDVPYYIVEQACWLDLDGDGYKEPYTTLVRYDTKELLRLVARFLPSGVEYNKKQEVVRILPEEHFTKYGFVPSPDGGWYDLGFGALLGPINESINSTINQLLDAGTLKNAGGGFLGRGAKIRGGAVSFRPAEWVRVDSTGDDLRKNVFPLPTPEPSPVLFQLLQILIDYGQRVAGAPDMVQGQNPGQNTPAETSRTMLEQGIKVFSGIYKRTYRAMREEFRKIYHLNSIFLEQSQEYVDPKSGIPTKVLQRDYQNPFSCIRPAADPDYMSDSQKMNQAMALAQRANPALGYDMTQVEYFYLDAWKIPNPERFIPLDPQSGKPVNQAGPDTKIQLGQMRLQEKQMEWQMKMQMKLYEMMEEHDLNKAKIDNLEAQAAAFLANASGAEMGHKIAAFDAALGAEKARMASSHAQLEHIRGMLELQQNQQEIDNAPDERDNSSTQ